jgi:hypothetical protein
MRIPRFRQRSLLSAGRRAGAVLRRFALNRFVPAKRVGVVEMGGRRYKRLRLSDASLAREIAGRLELFRDSALFPGLVAAVDGELLLEWVEGRPLGEPVDDAGLEAIAEFFAALYSAGPRPVATADTAFPGELQRDIAFLRDVGVLTPAAHSDVAAAAHALAPPEVFVGWDYLDPLPRNFVVTGGGRLVAVDVEDLRPDQLVGSGVAKARLRAAGGGGDRLLAALGRACALDLAPAMPFVELHFLAGWTKLAYLKGRPSLVDPGRFEAYRDVGTDRSRATSRPDSSR